MTTGIETENKDKLTDILQRASAAEIADAGSVSPAESFKERLMKSIRERENESAKVRYYAPANDILHGAQVNNETYPTPLPSAGMRETGKLPVHLVPAEFNLLLAAILEHGAYKYAPHNFEKGMDPDDLLRGAESHLMALKAGVIYDPDSGLPHAGHAAWNMLTFAMQMMREPSIEELFTNVVLQRRAGNLTAIAREYADKHGYDLKTTSPEFDPTPWHERVAALRGLMIRKTSASS